ncbi:MAG: hypothetical protein WCI80_05580 [Bacteroidota bacterium]|jgi:hypothetical protein
MDNDTRQQMEHDQKWAFERTEKIFDTLEDGFSLTSLEIDHLRHMCGLKPIVREDTISKKFFQDLANDWAGIFGGAK